jgi:hypothetical protein
MTSLVGEMVVGLKAHEQVISHWKALKAKARQTRYDPMLLPKRSELDLVALRKQLPQISLIEVNQSGLGFDFKQRLSGTGLYHAYGQEITGMALRDIYPEAAFHEWEQALSQIVKSAKPNVGIHSLGWRGAEALFLFWLRLPLSNQGQRVDMILGHDIIMGQKEALSSGIRAV